ncbi:Retrovirus-related Pol polyprotein from transposon TNT 1-94 [Cardamine amara subsp. amara]|uniref:Retrovirus-related Pol polyprotein from transposon TNT 1-94 n=1 Tax=Cardamine amara subsp. amara TaxID=228776 RepID=A0ABD0ZP14_CARAN
MNMVRSMIAAKKVPKMFWPDAVLWTFYVQNRCPTVVVRNMTPQEAWSGNKPSVEHFRVWGSLVHVHISYEKRGKFDDKNTVGIFVGFSEESKGYRIYNPNTKKIMISKDVVFEETKGWNWEEDEINENLSWSDDDAIWEDSDDEASNRGGSDDEENAQNQEIEEEVQPGNQTTIREV